MVRRVLQLPAQGLCSASFPSSLHVPLVATVSGRIARRHAGSFPVPPRRGHRTISKKSNYNFINGSRMIDYRRRASILNSKVEYRKAFHADLALARSHRAMVRQHLETNVKYLPLPVVLRAFFGKKKAKARRPRRGGGGSDAAAAPTAERSTSRTVMASRSYHGMTKDRLIVSAFFAFIRSGEPERCLTAPERFIWKRCRPSWLLDQNFSFALQQQLRKKKRLSSAGTMWLFQLVHRNDKGVPMAWDHYKKYLPVGLDDLVERGQTLATSEKLKRLCDETPRRRYYFFERCEVLRRMFRKEVKSLSKDNDEMAGKRAVRALLLEKAPRALKELAEEQVVVSKVMMRFLATPEAQMFNSGLVNYVNLEGARFTVRKRRRPEQSVIAKCYRDFKHIPLEERKNYYGIPPRFALNRATNGFQLLIRHLRHVHGSSPELVQIASHIWRHLNGSQKAAFEFPFPVYIKPIQSQYMPFHLYLQRQSEILCPPLDCHGKRPKWFYQQCRERWRTLSAAEKNAYDTPDELMSMFPLVQS